MLQGIVHCDSLHGAVFTMLFSSNPKSSSLTLRPPTAIPHFEHARPSIDQNDLGGFPLSYQDAHNFSARSSFSVSTCSFDYQTVEQSSIDPLHTQEQRRRNLNQVLEQENHTRERLRTIARDEGIHGSTVIGQEQNVTMPHVIEPEVDHKAGNTLDEEEEDRRGNYEHDRSMAPSPDSIRFSSTSERARRLSMRRVFVKKTSLSDPRKDGDSSSISEKRNTNNSSHGSTLTTGTTVELKDTEANMTKQDFIDELPDIDVLDVSILARGNDNNDHNTKIQLEYTYPDGGLKAWLQVLAAFLILLNTW